jgi:hypothetical protein
VSATSCLPNYETRAKSDDILVADMVRLENSLNAARDDLVSGLDLLSCHFPLLRTESLRNPLDGS